VMSGCRREDPEAGGDARFAERGSRGRRREPNLIDGLLWSLERDRERKKSRSGSKVPRTRCGSLGRTRSGLWREIEREKGAESGGNFEKIAVEAALKKENRDTEREGASLPAARVQARKWDAERERERERLQDPSDG